MKRFEVGNFFILESEPYFGQRSGLVRMKATRGREAATMKDKKEAKKPAENKVVGKRKAASRADKGDRKRAKNIASSTNKDPNKPKRPATAFFVFMEEFRTSYKQEHPKVKAISAVGKAGGEKWKSMSNAEKAPYKVKATERKSEYEKLMAAYNKKQESSDDEDEAESESSKDDEESEDDD
ncbi:high mobility group B protein 1-like [Gossypium australe]|uniref:High mobility group B protein 1-like n=1 Tax=Gossypium australe TaxID=47621 RepID=A0A5B6U7L4_9ROSI|nr:high mobility group B protein 1-like [Gossypium australe]